MLNVESVLNVESLKKQVREETDSREQCYEHDTPEETNLTILHFGTIQPYVKTLANAQLRLHLLRDI